MELGSSPRTERESRDLQPRSRFGAPIRKFIKKGDSSSGDQESWTLAEGRADRLDRAWAGGRGRGI